MLDSFLDTVYRHETEKTASAALQAKLRTMPTALVTKIAMSGISACAPGDSGDVKCWLDNFKGTPLFEKAVELERAEIQLEQADIEQRMQQQAQNTWTQRDALRLQKKMLELDLAMAGAGAEVPPEVSAEVAPEAAEEAAIGTLEQVQAEEAAAGEGNKPEEKMENAAIEQLHAAHGEGAQLPPQEKAPEQPVQAAPPGPPGAGAPPPPAKKEPPKPPVKKEPKEGEPSEDEKQASFKVAAATAAGRLLAKTAEPAPPKGMSVKEWDKVLQKKAAAGHSSIYGTPEEAASLAAQADQSAAHEEAHPVRTRLKNAVGPAALGALTGAALGGSKGNMRHMGIAALTGGALGAGLGARWKPGQMDREEANHIRAQLEPGLLRGEASELHQTANDIDSNPNKYRANRALAGGGLGAAAGAGLGNIVGHPGTGALLGGGLGAVLSALPKPVGKDHREAAQAIEQHLSKGKTAGINVGGLVGAAKAAVPQIAGVAKAGGNMLGTAMKAGGLPQVAKSVGNVATGFAKANPLAAAGAAGAAGIAAGRLSKGNSQPRA